MTEALLGISSEAVGQGCDEGSLTRCLAVCVNGGRLMHFSHFKPVPGLDSSIRVFGQDPFEDSVPFPHQLAPEGLAYYLMRLARTEARYPVRSGASVLMGWTIHRTNETDQGGHMLIVAQATWVDSRKIQ
jgi:hypothetical protein